MRAIESQMLAAIIGNYEWKKDNTEVLVFHDGSLRVLLHRNTIADIIPGVSIRLTDAGWQSTTTKSRLNALCSYFGLPSVCQKNHKWYQGDLEWRGEFTWSLAEEVTHEPQPEKYDAVLGGSQNQPTIYDAVLGGLK